MAVSSVRLKCTIAKTGWSIRDHYKMKPFFPNCPHDCTDSFQLIATMDQWTHTISKVRRFIVVQGTVHQGLYPIVRTDYNHSGIVADPTCRLREETEVIKAIELFSGAFSGWSQVTHHLNQTGYPMQTKIAVDNDHACRNAYVECFDAHAVGPHDFACSSQLLPECIFVEADVQHHGWLHLSGCEEIHWGLMSPPCQSWSLANAAAGLERNEGVACLEALGTMGLIGPKTIGIENVPGMISHPHWKHVVDLLEYFGFTLRWLPVVGLEKKLPQHRSRLLLIAVRTDSRYELQPHLCVSWRDDEEVTMASHQILMPIQDPWAHVAIPDRVTLAKYLNEAFRPKNHVSPFSEAKRSRTDLSHQRVRLPHDKVDCIMASYATAHELPERNLMLNGLFGSLVLHEGIVRFLQIPEIVCLFGAVHDVVIAQDLRLALRQMGNAIAVPHAALVICNLMAFFKQDFSQVDVLELCQKIIDHRFTADAIACCQTQYGFRIFRRPQHVPLTIPMHDLVQLRVCDQSMEISIWIEKGVNVWDALTLLFGSMQRVSIHFVVTNLQFAHVCIPKPFPLHCKSTKVRLSCSLTMMVSEALIRSTPMVTPACILFSPKGPVVLHWGSLSNVEHAVQIVCDFLELEQGVATDFLGSTIDDDAPMPYACMILPHELKHADLTCLEMLQFQHCGNLLTFTGSTVALQEFRDMIIATGTIHVLDRLGWFFVKKISGVDPENDEVVMLIKKPDAIAVESQDVGRALVTMAFMLQINSFRSIGCAPFQKCRIRLFDDWVWEGEIGLQSNVQIFQRAWDRACRIFGKETELPIRMLHHGQRFCLESPISAIIGTETHVESISISIVLGMIGGGPVKLRERPDLRIPPPPPLPTRLVQYDSQVDIFMNEQITYQQAITLALDMWRQCPEFLECSMQPERFVNLSAQMKDGLLIWEDDLDVLMDFTHALKEVGAEKIIHRMGWILATEFVTFGRDPKAKMIAFPKPIGRRVSCELIREFLQLVLLKYALPERVPAGRHTVRVRILMYQVPLFQNDIDMDVECSAFYDAWRLAYEIVGLPTAVRLIVNGKQAMPEFSLREYVRKGSDGSFTARVDYVLPLRGGGPTDMVPAGSKSMLATFLLTQGMALDNVATFVDNIARAGPMAFSAVLQSKSKNDKMSALTKLAESMNVKMPSFGSGPQQVKKKVQDKLSVDDAIDVTQIRLKRDFFLNQDNSACEQRNEPLPGAAGVCCISARDSGPWLNKIISQDEQAMLVIGKCPDTSGQSCQRMQIPAYYKDDPIILQVCCHQLGQKKVKTQEPETKTVTITGSEVVAITAWRDELGDKMWQKLLESPVRVCLNLLFSEGDMPELVCPPWGRVFHDSQGRSVKGEACTFQFHCRVTQTDLSKVLKASGRKGVYSTPKTELKQISTEYQIIWLQADSIQMAVAAGSQPKHLGIVRNNRHPLKMVKGLRFHRQDFGQAFAELKPNEEIPNRVQCKHLFKVSPIPPGAKNKDIQEWLDANQWQARPIRALNATCWLCGSEKPFSCDFTHWNNQPVLIKWIQQKDASQSCILAGEPKFQKRKEPNVTQQNKLPDLAFDPWKTYQPTDAPTKQSQALPSAVTRKIEAPIEDRFQSQQTDFQTLRDETSKQIEAIRTDMKAMQDNFGSAVQNFEQHQGKVQVEFQKIRTETQKQFTGLGQTFGETLKQAMSQQDSSIAAQIAGLKELLTNRPTPQKKFKPAPSQTQNDAEVETVDGNL